MKRLFTAGKSMRGGNSTILLLSVAVVLTMRYEEAEKVRCMSPADQTCSHCIYCFSCIRSFAHPSYIQLLHVSWTNLLEAISPSFEPAITCVINASAALGTFPATFKQAPLTPLLRKPSLDPASVENHCPVVLPSFLSCAITEV